ncbi:MAG TPA: sodium:calcium antiporter [Actinobacteria bacterium]|nr:sodium:calcium antiporter [Actinomycetota bacterium]
MIVDGVQAVVGLGLLVVASDRMVRSTIRVSNALGVSAILIGAVIVGFGTSVPEFLVSGLASLEGNLDLAMSNVTSSNAANVTLVLGVAAVISPVAARRGVIRREGALMIVAVVALAAVLAGGHPRLWQGVVLFAGLVGATTLMTRWAREDPEFVLAELEELAELPDGDGNEEAVERLVEGRLRRLRSEVGRELLIGLVALVITLVAADQLLDGAVGLGTHIGLSATFIGLMTGVGTSLPELAAAVAASRHGEGDLVLGNVLGSNIFNSLGVAGLAIALRPAVLVAMTPGVVALMVAAVFAAGFFAFSGQRVVRLEGAVLLAGFVAYSVVLY